MREKANAHVDYLADLFRITVRRTQTWRTSEAVPLSGQVFVPRVLTAFDYLVTLHELAHIYLSLDTSVLDEARAWNWALEWAEPDVLAAMTKTEWRRMGLCWASHAGPVW